MEESGKTMILQQEKMIMMIYEKDNDYTE